jgi:DNA-directed RNA polymerase subunit RPC12/RpoP
MGDVILLPVVRQKRMLDAALVPDAVPADEHIQGRVRCLNCDHEWHGSAPTWTTGLECPKCGSQRGALTEPPAFFDENHWTCECRCQVFCITNRRVYCINCGKTQKFKGA